MVSEVPGAFVVLVTAASEDEARRIAEALVTERLAACCNLLPGVRSIYRWQGKVCHDDEILLVIKTSEKRFDDLERRVRELHSYDVPEVVALPMAAASEPYLAWLREQCGD